jgi:hypothetical protein
MGADQPANSENCILGNEAYCCSGKPDQIVVPRGVGPIADKTTIDFDIYLQQFLKNPVCPKTWEAQYSAMDDIVARNVSSINAAKVDQTFLLTRLLQLLSTLITS